MVLRREVALDGYAAGHRHRIPRVARRTLAERPPLEHLRKLERVVRGQFRGKQQQRVVVVPVHAVRRDVRRTGPDPAPVDHAELVVHERAALVEDHRHPRRDTPAQRGPGFIVRVRHQRDAPARTVRRYQRVGHRVQAQLVERAQHMVLRAADKRHQVVVQPARVQFRHRREKHLHRRTARRVEHRVARGRQPRYRVPHRRQPPRKRVFRQHPRRAITQGRQRHRQRENQPHPSCPSLVLACHGAHCSREGIRRAKAPRLPPRPDHLDSTGGGIYH